jgi:tRNA G18 (ribose-2'-O)-methylase SpoU
VPSLRKLTPPEIDLRRSSRALPGGPSPLPIFALLDNIRSLYNVGSVFRTADGAGIAHLFLTGYTPFPPRKEIEKTALGATSSVPWSHHRDPIEAIVEARARGARICVMEHTTESQPYDRVDPTLFPLCLVVGNELTGVSPSVIAQADLALEIPMAGVKQSLNVAVAFGIAAFELGRIWRGRPREISG